MSLELGLTLFQNQKFQESIPVLSSVCKNDESSFEDKFTSLEYLIKISRVFNSDTNIIHLSLNVLKNSSPRQKEKIIGLMNYSAEKLWNESLESDDIFLIAQSYNEIGAYSKANHFLNEIADYYLKNSYNNELAKLINENKSKSFDHLFSNEYRLSVAVAIGNVEEVSVLMPLELITIIDRESNENLMFTKIRSKFAKKMSFWKNSNLFPYEIMSRIMSVNNHTLAFEKKKIVNMILDRILMSPKEVTSYVLLAEYAKKTKNKNLCEKCHRCLNTLKNDKSETLKSYLKKLEAYMLQLKETESFDEFNTGSVFAKSSIKKDVSKAIERNEPNELVSDTKKDSDILMERQINKILDMYDEKFFRENFKDIVSCLNFLNMTDIVISQTRRMIELSKENEVELNAILAQAHYDAHDYYSCLDCCYEVLESFELSTEEYCFFCYLAGESYVAIGMLGKGKEFFMKVKKINTKYRLVNTKLRELA